MTIQDSDYLDISLERYVDGEMDVGEKAEFEELLKESVELQRNLRMAEAIKRNLKLVEQPTCPPHVSAEIMSEVSRERRVWRGGPAMGLALAASLVIAVLVWQPFDSRTPDAEVEQAIEDAKWAVAFVSDLGRTSRAGNREEILETGVVDPVQHALDYLFVGDQDED